MTMICPLRLINPSDQPDYGCIPTCALRRVIDNENELDYICALGNIPLASALMNIVNFDKVNKPQEMIEENINLKSEIEDNSEPLVVEE